MGLLSIRIVGTESEVAEAVGRQELVLNVLGKRGPSKYGVPGVGPGLWTSPLSRMAPSPAATDAPM